MTAFEMLDEIIHHFGFESPQAVNFAFDMENGDDMEWLKFLYDATMNRKENIY